MTGNPAGPTLQQWAAQCITLADALTMIDSLADQLKEKNRVIAELGQKLAVSERKGSALKAGKQGEMTDGGVGQAVAGTSAPIGEVSNVVQMAKPVDSGAGKKGPRKGQ